MAEYVRRRRPPATHPYWAPLHDRANPPGLGSRTAVPGGLGMGGGLYAGLNDPMPWTEAMSTAFLTAAGFAGVVFATSVPVLVLDVSRHLTGRDRWPGALVSSALVAVLIFGTMLVFLGLLLTGYSACSGLGPWRGLLAGLTIGGLPGAAWAGVARWRWRRRQEQWPRWERMRAPRSARALTRIPAPAPATPAPAARLEAAQPAGRRVAE